MLKLPQAITNKFPRKAATVLGLIVSVSLLACGEPPPATGGHGDGDALFPKLPRVTGHIDAVDANPENLRHFRSLQITDGSGTSWRFESEGWVGVSVGHLKDHQIQGTPVTVWYEKRPNGALTARFVGD